jgi:LAGLIDADG-like domain
MDRNRRPWTSQDLDELRSRFPVEYSADIAHSMSRTPAAIRRRAGLLGLQKSGGRYQRSHKHYSLNAQAFGVLTRDTAYLLGMILADGSVSGDRMKVTNNNLDVLQFARHVLGSNHPIAVPRNPRDKSFTLYIRNTELVNGLRQWGIVENKSLIGTWPAAVPADLFGCLLRGYFDGDGYARYSSRHGLAVKFTSGSRELLTGLSVRLHEQGVPQRSVEQDKGRPNANRLRYNGSFAARVGEIMYARDGFYLPYKRQPFFDQAVRESPRWRRGSS